VEGTGSHAGGDFVFTISRGATSEAETVSYALGGTATAGIDYVVPSGLANFAIGQSTVQIHLSVRRDAVAERDETVVMKLGIVNAGGLIDPAHAVTTGVIIDDEPRTINGTNHADVLNGRPFVDTINGLGGNDVIHGGSSNDRLVGGRGADVLRGDQGSDRFVFKSILDSAGASRDTILDFRHGQDKIDLSAIDADVSQAGNQAFHWLGEAGFTLSPGQLIEKLFNRPGTASDRTVVFADVNGDGHADMQIALVGLKHLVASDFVL
jgi:Ca2+-binding RTX toxin-like protein